MKTVNLLSRKLGRASAILAVASMIWLPNTIQAQKGGERLMQLNRINTVEDLKAVEPGDMVVMSCPKCRETWVTTVQPPAKAGAPSEAKPVLRHECPGCGTQITFEGSGKQGKQKAVHVCKHCGSKEATCCVLKKGSMPAPGMAK